MANTNAPSGLTPVRHLAGGVIRTNAHQIASALASNIYRGSAVIPVNTTKRIDVAAAGNRVLGVFDGVSYIDSNGDVQIRPRWATGTAIKSGTVAEAQVYDDPLILFAAQMSGSAGAVATDIGNFADLVIGTGNANSGQSGDMIDQATLTSTVATGGQVRVDELLALEGNAFGQYAKVGVRFNEHYNLGSTTAGNAVTCY